MKTYARLAATGVLKISKGGTDKQTLVERIQLTADAAGTLTVSDGIASYVLDVVAGINNAFCFNLIFTPGAAVTFTGATANISVFVDYTFK